MDIPLTKLIALTTAKHAMDVRCAAVTVLGELNARDPEAQAAVLAALSADEMPLRVRAIRAAGQLRIEKSLPILLERINHGGQEAERAAEAAAALGAKGTQALQDKIHKVVPGVQKYIAAALAHADASGSKEASGVDMLMEKNPAAVDAAVQALAGHIPTLDAKRKKSLADDLFALAKDKKTKLTPAGEAGMVRLAALLDDERVEPLLWDRTQSPTPPDVRAAALQALGKFMKSPAKDERAKLFACAGDPLFRVAAPAMMLLDKIPMTDKLIAEWLPLLQANDLAVRRLALGKLGDRDTPDVTAALLTQTTHPDRKYRDEVFNKLATLATGRKALAKPLKDAETADEAWTLARVVAPFAKGDAKTWGDELFTALGKHLESNDRRADALIFVLKEAGAVELRDRLEAKAVALKKKEDFEKSHIYYRAAARDPAAGFSIRLGLATVGLKLSNKDLDAEARAREHCLHQFADLIRQDEPATFAEVEKTKWLEAEELYYLGFHFVDHAGVMGDFGAKALKHLLKRFPKNKLAANAKNKLKSSGQK